MRCVDNAVFCLSHSSLDGYVGCLPLLTNVNSAAMNTGAQKSAFLLFVLWGIYPEAELLFNFLRNRHTVFHNSCTILYSHKTDNFSTSLPTHFVLFLCNSHPNRWKVVPHCGFDLHFPSDSLAVALSILTVFFFSYACWPFVYLFWRSVFSNPLPVLALVV